MPRVQLPDGRIVEFPEGTSPAEMERALADVPAPPGPRIGTRAGQVYRAIAEPVTRSIAETLSPSAWAYWFTHPRRRDPEEQWKRVGAVPRFLAGAVIPQTPTEAALYASTWGLGPKLLAATEGIKAGGPLISSLLRGSLRTAPQAAVGAGTAAVTGEEPLVGAAKGTAVGLGAEGLRALWRALGRRVVPTTVEGYAAAAAERGPRIVRGVLSDIPALRGIVSKYSDLPTLIDPQVGRRVGQAIYGPVRDLMRTRLQGVRFDFPYLRPGPMGRLGLPPTISELLPPKTVAVLRRAGNLNVNEALDVIQQLKALASAAPTDAIGRAAGNFARQMEQDFTSVLTRHSPVLAGMYDAARHQYAAFVALREGMDKNLRELFPAAGRATGYNEAAWGDMFARIPQRLLTTTRNIVTRGGEFASGAAIETPAMPIRLYHWLGERMRASEALRPTRSIRIGTEPPTSRAYRVIPSVAPAPALSGVQALTGPITVYPTMPSGGPGPELPPLTPVPPPAAGTTPQWATGMTPAEMQEYIARTGREPG